VKIQASYLDSSIKHGRRIRLDKVDDQMFAIPDENGQYVVTAVYEEDFIVFVDEIEKFKDVWGEDTEVSVTNIENDSTVPGNDWKKNPITQHEITNNGHEERARMQSLDDEQDIDENSERVSGLFLAVMTLEAIPENSRVNIQAFNNQQIALPADDGEYVVYSNLKNGRGILVAPYKDEKRIKERQLANRYLLGRTCGAGRQSKADFISPEQLKRLRELKKDK